MESLINNKYSFALVLTASLADKFVICHSAIQTIHVKFSYRHMWSKGYPYKRGACRSPVLSAREKERNPKLVPYETIVRAASGEPEAVDEVFRHYAKRIRLASLENGQVSKDTEDNIKRRLIAALLQFRFDEQEV